MYRRFPALSSSSLPFISPQLTCGKVEQGLRPGRVAGVEGMWITGQDVTTNGFAGALMGGVVTAHGILGYGFMDLALCGREPWKALDAAMGNTYYIHQV